MVPMEILFFSSATMSSDPHWVTELFPPTFGFTLNELEKLPVPDTEKGKGEKDTEDEGKSNTQEDEASVPPSPRKDKKTATTEFEKRLAYHIAPEDVASIKNVYQRVWLMNRLKGEAEQQLDNTGTNRCDACCISSLLSRFPKLPGPFTHINPYTRSHKPEED